jgi:acyl-coenzyme A thioesterase PaaI-like protein
MYYIAAAPLGTLVRIVSRTIAQGKVIAVMEARIEERTTGKLLAKGTHVKQDNTPHQYKL